MARSRKRTLDERIYIRKFMGGRFDQSRYYNMGYITWRDGDNMIDIEIAILTVIRERGAKMTLESVMQAMKGTYPSDELARGLINMMADNVITIDEEGLLNVTTPHAIEI